VDISEEMHKLDPIWRRLSMEICLIHAG
jgi:hypothetical protein